MISYKLVDERLKYNPDTGLLIWKTVLPKQSQSIGDIAGCFDWNGYIRIKLFGKAYLAHRLVWLLVYGEFPPIQIDHINHNRSDNRISNLRSVSHKINHQNKKLTANNTSKICGVCWHKTHKRWRSRIKAEGKRIHLGNFKDWFDAVCARKSAEHKYGFHINHGVL